MYDRYARWLLWCLPVYLFCTLIALAFACELFHTLRLLCLCIFSCTQTALVCSCVLFHNTLTALAFAFVLNCALWLLWCLPLQYVMHSACSGVCLCTNCCAMVALAFACVITMSCTPIAMAFACALCCALWLLLCLPAHYVVHSGCSGVCICAVQCMLNALVLACVMFHARGLLWCLHV